jgi:serine O-acetyltransferase
MNQTATKLIDEDPIWDAIRQAAVALIREEPLLASLLHACILNQADFEGALNYVLAGSSVASTRP